MTRNSARPPILLPDARYYGTLAAVRCLGRAGIPVTVADPHRFALARLSRYATRGVSCPTLDDPDQFIEWLLEFGRHGPRHVLYPTSDNFAWLYSLHASELSEVYDMYQPSLECLRLLLDKRELSRLCTDIGLGTPPSYFVESDDEAGLVAELEVFKDERNAIGYPMLIKPATRVLALGYSKGSTVTSPSELVPAYKEFAAQNGYLPSVLRHMPGVAKPMLQAYLPEAVQGIYSVAGFANRAGRVTALASRKVLQRPRKLGIGLCFEEEPLHAGVIDGLSALCQRTGYFGVFESEFIVVDGRHLLIDFNPRFYSQMAFEIDRGLPLPEMAYEAARGRDDLTPYVSRSFVPLHGDGNRAYSHGLVLALVLLAQRLAGRMSADEVSTWVAWRRAHREGLTDAVMDRGDPGPVFGEIVTRLKGYALHPAVTVRSMVFNK